MNKGTQIWIVTVVDKDLEDLQPLRDKAAARKDHIRQLKRQLRDKRQLKNAWSADDEFEKQT
jgi:hypothetical protein